MKDVSKALGKKFAWGNSIVKDKESNTRVILLTGDLDEDDLKQEIKAFRK
jgi:hypothetical protein